MAKLRINMSSGVVTWICAVNEFSVFHGNKKWLWKSREKKDSSRGVVSGKNKRQLIAGVRPA